MRAWRDSQAGWRASRLLASTSYRNKVQRRTPLQARCLKISDSVRGVKRAEATATRRRGRIKVCGRVNSRKKILQEGGNSISIRHRGDTLINDFFVPSNK